MNIASYLLVNLHISVMFVHPSNIVQDVFVEDFSQLFVLDVEQSQQKLDCLHRVQDIFRTQDHDRPNAFFSHIRVEVRAMIFQ